MQSELVLVMQSVMFVSFAALLFRREPLWGVFFFFLLIYTLFAQIGYLWFPDLSDLLRAHFGIDIWSTYTWFIVLSGISLFTVLWFAGPTTSTIPIELRSARNRIQQPGALLVWGLIVLWQWTVITSGSVDLSWEAVQNEDLFQASFQSALFVLSVKLSVAVCLGLYCAWRMQILKGWGVSLFTVASILSFLTFATELGNRTDPVAMFLGMLVFEAKAKQFSLKQILRFVFTGGILLVLLQQIATTRADSGLSFGGTAERILFNDYFPPAHILFAAIGLDYIDPAEVFFSNASNSLILLNYPYLQSTVTELFNPGIATRSAGYAFYIFSEGWIFAGFWGFLYNAFVIGFYLILWRKLGSTRSKELNLFIAALMGAMAVNLVRGQSSYFIKILYTFILPGLLFYLSVARQRLVFLRKQ